MKRLKVYYLKGFFKVFSILSMGLSLVMSLCALIGKLDGLTPLGRSAGEIAFYGVLNFPKYLSYVMPLAALLSGLFDFGQASKFKETVAVKAGGGRLKLLLMPFILTGAGLSLFNFGLNEFVVPEASVKAKDMSRPEKKAGRPLFEESMGTVWLRAKDGSFVRLGFYLPERNLAKDVSIFRTAGGRLLERIEAAQAEYGPDGWLLEDVRIYDIERGQTKELARMSYRGLESPKALLRDVRKPEEMGIAGLRRYLKKLKEAGLRNPKLTVDMQAKVSYPFVNLFMLAIGVSLSVRRGMGGLLSGGLGLLIALLYWVGFTTALSLGYAGILPASAAAWLAPSAFGAVAVYLYRTIPE